MAGHGHVPKFNGPNAGNFTETFTNARSGGKGGAGEPRLQGSKATSNPPPTRRAPQQRGRPAGTTATATAAMRRPAPTYSKPSVPVSDGGLYGDSHIPTFGTWNVDGDQNYTGIFQAASKAKKGEVVGPAVLVAASGGTAHQQYTEQSLLNLLIHLLLINFAWKGAIRGWKSSPCWTHQTCTPIFACASAQDWNE